MENMKEEGRERTKKYKCIFIRLQPVHCRMGHKEAQVRKQLISNKS